MEKQTVIKGQKELKRGYTTGTCAAVAARAAAIMLFSGEEIREVRITVPAGETLLLEVEDRASFRCGVMRGPERCRR